MSHKIALKNIGLEDAEAEIYLTCLRLGFPKVADIAKEIAIPRTSIYLHIKNLLEKGFVKKSLRGKIEHFAATSPEVILEKEKERVEHFAGIVPALERLADLSLAEARVEHFDTVNGIRRFYEMLLEMKSGGEMPMLVESREASEVLLQKLGWEFWGGWYEKIAKKKIATQGVVTDDSLPLLASMPDNVKATALRRNTVVRVVNAKEFPFSVSFYLFPPDKSFLIIPQQNSVLSVKSMPLFQSLRGLYAALFAAGKPLDLREL